MIRVVEILSSAESQIAIIDVCGFNSDPRRCAAVIINELALNHNAMAQTLTFEFDEISNCVFEGISDQIFYLKTAAFLVDFASEYAINHDCSGIFDAIPSWKFCLV